MMIPPPSSSTPPLYECVTPLEEEDGVNGGMSLDFTMRNAGSSFMSSPASASSLGKRVAAEQNAANAKKTKRSPGATAFAQPAWRRPRASLTTFGSDDVVAPSPFEKSASISPPPSQSRVSASPFSAEVKRDHEPGFRAYASSPFAASNPLAFPSSTSQPHTDAATSSNRRHLSHREASPFRPVNQNGMASETKRRELVQKTNKLTLSDGSDAFREHFSPSADVGGLGRPENMWNRHRKTLKRDVRRAANRSSELSIRQIASGPLSSDLTPKKASSFQFDSKTQKAFVKSRMDAPADLRPAVAAEERFHSSAYDAKSDPWESRLYAIVTTIAIVAIFWNDLTAAVSLAWNEGSELRERVDALVIRLINLFRDFLND